MDVGQSLYQQLAWYSGLGALVGDRIYLGVVPQGKPRPAVTYKQISKRPIKAMGSSPTLKPYRFQVTAWALKDYEAKAVAEQVEACLADFSGTLGTTGVTVQRIYLDDQVDLIDHDNQANQTNYGVATDFIIWAEG